MYINNLRAWYRELTTPMFYIPGVEGCNWCNTDIILLMHFCEWTYTYEPGSGNYARRAKPKAISGVGIGFDHIRQMAVCTNHELTLE